MSRFVAMVLLAFLPTISQTARAQGTDCVALANELVLKNFQSSSSDSSKLLFLYSLTQMDLKTSSEALGHSGQVAVGPISIGPGTWNKDTQDQLRADLQKIVNLEQLTNSATSVAISSGEKDNAKVIETCFTANGGLFVALNELGKHTAVVELMWTSYPGPKTSAIVDSVTVVNGNVIGGDTFTKKGAKLNDRLKQRITINRSDPKLDLSVIVNTTNAGSAEGYLPPSELPPPPPPKIIRAKIAGDSKEVGSAGRFDGWKNPGCSAHESEVCVAPQHGGKIVPGSGKPLISSQSGASGTKNATESPEEYCVTLWAHTSDCQVEVSITGAASATEEYTQVR